MPALASEEIDLWIGGPLGAESPKHAELPEEPFADGVTIVRNVSRPVLLPIGDVDATRPAVIVAPGGAFRFLAIEHEGRAVAEWVHGRGFAAYVLKYRVVETPVDPAGFRAAMAELVTGKTRWDDVPPNLLADGAQAVLRAREVHERVVMVGFSAGARLTVEALRSDAPPDAAALIYPPAIPGLDAAPAEAPPIFTLMACDDPLGTKGALALHDRWRAAGRSSELHLFERGGHGFGMNPQGLPVDRWLDLLGDWLESVGSRT